MAESIKFKYMHKSELNLETQRFYNKFGSKKTFDVICVCSELEGDEINTDVWSGFVSTLRNFMTSRVNKTQKFLD